MEKGERQKRANQTEMKGDERGKMEEIIAKETERQMEQVTTLALGPQALHVLISQIDCIDFIPLMW